MIRLHDLPSERGKDYSLRVFALDAADLPQTETVPCESKHNRAIRDRAKHGSERGGSSAWYGHTTRAKMASYLATGWPQGAARIAEVTNELRAENIVAPATVKRAPRWCDEGNDFDLDRYLRGDMDIMYREARRHRTGRGLQTVSLGVIWCVNATTSAESMFWQGAVLCILGDLLEDAGYVTELHALSSIHQHPAPCREESPRGGDTYIDITVKHGGEPLQRDTLAATVAHVAAWRSFGFDLLASAADPVTYTLGACAPASTYPSRAQYVTDQTAGAVPALDLITPMASDRIAAVLAVRSTLAWLNGAEALGETNGW